MSYGKVISLNDEPIEMPKIRRDQHKRIMNIVRTNAEFPEVALGLVRDYAKGLPFVRSIQHDEVNREIKLILKSDSSSMMMEYSFRLEAPILLETPTL